VGWMPENTRDMALILGKLAVDKTLSTPPSLPVAPRLRTAAMPGDGSGS